MRRRCALSFEKAHLDRIEVGQKGRQEQEAGATFAENGCGPGAAAHREVVEDDDIARLQGGGEPGLDPGVEGG